MGLGGISIWQLLIVLAIIILLFGTKRLRSFGSDLGNAVKGFRKAMDDDGEKDKENKEQDKIPPQQNGDENSNTASKAETKEEKR